MNQRPSPDNVLKRVQAEEAQSHRGRLKLFFGASPGVGKTYAMLEAARQRKKEGWDVVVGLVETHGRAETEALLNGLDILPRREVAYKGVTLKEFDLDAALARRPRLILVDELAHTNAAGLRHAKRWQDIEELLNAGIDVYTTLNVQHWETLNDVVARITGITVRETVPDTFLRRAHELEFVDLAPEDLLKRLKDGKVYHGELADRAAERFFKPGNLIALRELALRHAAERVDAQMQAYKERHAIGELWAVGERLLVGVSASPMSARLIRETGRLAGRLHAPWIAVHVETPAFFNSAPQERRRAVENLRLAEKLGAETVTLSGADVTAELIAFARARNVTQIILGQPAEPRWKERVFGSIVSQVARQCGDINLHVISGSGAAATDRPAPPVAPNKWRGLKEAALVTATATVVCWPLLSILDRANLVMIYLLGVVFTAYRFNRRAAIFASFLSVLCFDFFFVPPYLTFSVSDTQYLFTFIVMLGVALTVGTITGRLRLQTDILRERAEHTRVLYRLSRDLSETPDVGEMFKTAHARLSEFYGMPILLLLATPNGSLDVGAGDPAVFGWNDNEASVARWTLDHAQMAGAGSDTLSGAAGFYMPMKGIRSTIGVLALRPPEPRDVMEPERLRLLETFASEIGGAVESTRMSEEIGRAEMHLERQTMPAAPPNFQLSGALAPDRILVLDEPKGKEEIIRLLLSRLSVRNKQAALRAVLDREKAGATVIGDAVAIPHARLNGVNAVQAALAISAADAVPIWILFVSPAADTIEHLAFLAGLAGFFKTKEHAATLATLKTPDEIFDYLRRFEKAAF